MHSYLNVCFSAGLWLAVCCVSSPLIGCGAVMWYEKKSRDTLRRSKAMIFMRIWLILKWILPTILESGRKNKIHNRGVDDFCTLLEKVWGRWEGKNLQSSPVSPSPYLQPVWCWYGLTTETTSARMRSQYQLIRRPLVWLDWERGLLTKYVDLEC